MFEQHMYRSAGSARGRRNSAALLLCSLVAAVGMSMPAAAADAGIVIEDEATFAARYQDQVERIAPGVYLFEAGAYAGKVVTIGAAGLDYDIALLRAQLKSRAGQGTAARALADLEAVKATLRDAPAVSAKANSSGPLSCFGYSPQGEFLIYGGNATVDATARIVNNNPYYAEAFGRASAFVAPPFRYYPSFTMQTCAYAENKHTGQSIGGCTVGTVSASKATGPLQTLPSFGHHMVARAYVYGLNDCRGYVAVADELRL